MSLDDEIKVPPPSSSYAPDSLTPFKPIGAPETAESEPKTRSFAPILAVGVAVGLLLFALSMAAVLFIGSR